MQAQQLIARRYHVHDEMGLLRSFHTKQEALHFIGKDQSLTLRIDPRPKKVKLDLSLYEEAPF